MLVLTYSLILVFLSALPVVLFILNLSQFRGPPSIARGHSTFEPESVSVLIPARNEASGIRAALEAILANGHPRFEVIVMDDASTDATAEIVAELARHESRLNLLVSQPLPAGWNGKQFACWQLAQAARFDWLLFLDADVRLGTEAIERVQAAAVSAKVDLLSGFPKQLTLTLAEKVLIPLMHFILLGYLPMSRMRASRRPEYSAGCGQLFLARRQPYFECGGHQAILASRHDGIALPRAFRKQALSTDIFDAADIAACRMYRSAGEVVRGLLKNATEGIARPTIIFPLSVLLLGAGCLPAISLGVSLWFGWSPRAIAVLGVATLLSYLPRVMAAIRFEQSWLGATLHPVGVAWFVWLQWWALARQAAGKPIAWRGRIDTARSEP